MTTSRKPRRYGVTSARPNGAPEDPTKCIEGVWGGYLSMFEHQCTRKRGYGPNGLYCKQHAAKQEPSK